MAYDFNANEVFDMAIQIEQNGTKFYKNAAEGVAKPEEKELLLKLAEMEVDHENTFAEMKRSLSEDEKAKTVFDPENETVLYLKALADTRVFFQKTINTGDMKEILKEAIVAEKDSIVFYLGMKDLVPEGKGKNRLDAIIKEEMGHIRLLSKELMAIK
ncbi:ferritin family protein [Desulfobotulus sp. H1]|uniref:Ferritin family protein n=1 Tax=Desulfobotulus pelophilus TaxID=2823377 RepID=A0ABT3NAV0_9BACT|nr:ferritin family protein [Desulfobotulus pelophilus]MCW7754587.1 ferritin family protein [Desulfobotulus pelophilus]